MCACVRVVRVGVCIVGTTVPVLKKLGIKCNNNLDLELDLVEAGMRSLYTETAKPHSAPVCHSFASLFSFASPPPLFPCHKAIDCSLEDAAGCGGGGSDSGGGGDGDGGELGSNVAAVVGLSGKTAQGGISFSDLEGAASDELPVKCPPEVWFESPS